VKICGVVYARRLAKKHFKKNGNDYNSPICQAHPTTMDGYQLWHFGWVSL
jgi:hypothetical protein